MAKKKPSFEVRERRRFKETAATETELETAEEAGNSRTSPEVDGTKPAAPETDNPDAVAAEPDRSDTQTSSEAPQEPRSDQQNTSGPQPNTDTDPGSNTESDTGSGMPDISVFGVLQFTVGTLSQLAWQGMGLIANSATGKLEPRMSEARTAIDALRALIPVMSPSLDESSRRELQTLLSNLQLNYVEQVKRREV